MQAEQFFIPSIDGKAHIFGEINFRGDPSRRRQMVVLVPGTGHTHRVAFSYLAHRLTMEGHAVARFDTRGVRCANIPADPVNMAKDIPCLDKKTIESATLEARLDDIGGVIQFAARHPFANAQKPLLIGHSYGIGYISHLVEQWCHFTRRLYHCP
jgi:pimeloyl-ACP methyl ester carboxylesterase